MIHLGKSEARAMTLCWGEDLKAGRCVALPLFFTPLHVPCYVWRSASLSIIIASILHWALPCAIFRYSCSKYIERPACCAVLSRVTFLASASACLSLRLSLLQPQPQYAFSLGLSLSLPQPQPASASASASPSPSPCLSINQHQPQSASVSA